MQQRIQAAAQPPLHSSHASKRRRSLPSPPLRIQISSLSHLLPVQLSPRLPQRFLLAVQPRLQAGRLALGCLKAVTQLLRSEASGCWSSV